MIIPHRKRVLRVRVSFFGFLGDRFDNSSPIAGMIVPVDFVGLQDMTCNRGMVVVVFIRGQSEKGIIALVKCLGWIM